MTNDQDRIEKAVTQKIADCYSHYTPNEMVVSPYDENGRVIAGPDHIYRIQLRDIALTLGVELFEKIPSRALLAFAVRAAERNESTGELLQILIGDFIIAYGSTEHSEAVIANLAYLHFLAESGSLSN